MMHYTDNPIRDAENYQADQERWLENRPVCDLCGDHIVDDRYFKDDDGIFCEECWHDHVSDVYMILIEE